MTPDTETKLTPQHLSEALKLLTRMQGREFDRGDLDAWFNMLRDIDGPLLVEATTELIRDTHAFITPSRIRERAGAIAAGRVREVWGRTPEPPSGLTEPEYRTWLAAQLTAIVRGAPMDEVARIAAQSIGREPEPTPEPGGAGLPVRLRHLDDEGRPVGDAAGRSRAEQESQAPDEWSSDTGPYVPYEPGGGPAF